MKKDNLIDELAMVRNVCLYGNVLRREDGHVLRRALEIEAMGIGRKWRPKRTSRSRLSKKVCRLL